MTRIVTFTVSTENPGLSGEIDLQDYKDFAVEMSTAWTGSALSAVTAAITKPAGSTAVYWPLQYQGARQPVDVAASNTYSLSTMGLDAVRFIRFQSTDEQAAPRTLKLICK